MNYWCLTLKEMSWFRIKIYVGTRLPVVLFRYGIWAIAVKEEQTTNSLDGNIS
jgi:hypothetical protein